MNHQKQEKDESNLKNNDEKKVLCCSLSSVLVKYIFSFLVPGFCSLYFVKYCVNRVYQKPGGDSDDPRDIDVRLHGEIMIEMIEVREDLTYENMYLNSVCYQDKSLHSMLVWNKQMTSNKWNMWKEKEILGGITSNYVLMDYEPVYSNESIFNPKPLVHETCIQKDALIHPMKLILHKMNALLPRSSFFRLKIKENHYDHYFRYFIHIYEMNDEKIIFFSEIFQKKEEERKQSLTHSDKENLRNEINEKIEKSNDNTSCGSPFSYVLNCLQNQKMSIHFLRSWIENKENDSFCMSKKCIYELESYEQIA